MRLSCFWMPATLLILTVSPATAQTMAVLQGRVLDPSGAALAGASIVVRDLATGFTSAVPTDAEGRYHVPAIPAGAYQVTAAAPGFRSERIEALTFEVGRTLVRDFQLPSMPGVKR
jgi:protocatechuate 3,4-dioxygenase beta subunit